MSAETAEVDAAASASDGSRRSVTVAVVVLAVLLTVLAAGAIVGAVTLRGDVQRDDARAAAIAAARQEALNLTSIDGRNLTEDLKRVLDGATGGFKADFAQRSKDLATVLTANQVVASGRVLDAALVRGDRNTATVLVVVDSVVKNKAAPAGRANTYRMQLDVERHGSRWLTSSLEFVG